MNAVVMFSSGAGSWAAARRYVDANPGEHVTLLFADTKIEDEDNYRFLHEAAADIGRELVIVADGRTPWKVFNDEHMIGNNRAALCSRRLKQEPARAWLAANTDEQTIVVVGIDWTEQHRLPAVEAAYAPRPVAAPLCQPPYTDKATILTDLRARGIEPPRLYAEGFAHANCGGACVRAGQGQWAHLLKQRPETFAEWDQQEQRFRERFGFDVAVLRDRSRTGVLEHMGLTEADLTYSLEPTGMCDSCGEARGEHSGGEGCGDFREDMERVARVTATAERLPSLVPLPLRVLRGRIEQQPEQIDMFDIGGCGCFVDEGGAA